ncbi:hypothetical protein Tco_1181660 [Tanacetum coccineum]
MTISLRLILFLVLLPFRGISTKMSLETLFQSQRSLVRMTTLSLLLTRLYLIGMSHNYTLDEDTYLTFLHDDGTEMDLFAFIQVEDPTKVKVGEWERAEEEARLLDSIVGHVVPLLPVAPARVESELKASVEILFDEGGSADQGDSAARGGHDAEIKLVTGVRIIVAKNVTAERPKHPRKKRQAATVANGSSHPPKNMLNVEAGVTAVATLPMVTYSVSATPEHESGPPTNFITELNLRTLDQTERFVISSDSSHHSSTNAAKAGIDSFVRFVTPPLVMTEAVTTTNVASIPFAPTLEIGTKVITTVYASVFQDSDSTRMVKLDAAGSSHVPEKVLSMGSWDINSKTLHEVFVPQWNVSNDTLLNNHDVSRDKRRRLESECEKQADLQKARDAKVESLKAQLLLKETKAAEATRLRAQVSTAEAMEKIHAAEIDSLKQRNDLELEGLNAVVSSLRSQKDGLVDQVHALETTCSGLHDQVSGYEQLKEQIEEFQDAQMNAVNEKVAKLDADLLEMACHLEEKIYPYLLTIISRQRWILTHGMKLFLVKCLNSSDYLTALGAAVSRAIEQGMQSGLAVGIDHGREGRSLTNFVAYNPDAEADFNFALQKLREVYLPLFAELKSHKDASIENIMNLRTLKGPLADAPGMSDLQPDVEQLRVPIHRSKDQVVLGETSLSFALSVSHSRMKHIRENIMA